MPTDLQISRAAAPVAPAQPSQTEFRLTGRHVLAGFVGFFVVVALVNGFMMFAAIRTMPGLDAGRNGYDVSQRYNAEIRAAAAQAARGWRTDAVLSTRGNVSEASVTFVDSAGAPVRGLGVELRLAHPSDRRLDRVMMLTATEQGEYAAVVPAIASGSWDVTIVAAREGVTLYQSRHRKQL